MKAPDELVKAFEEIGYEKIPMRLKDVSTQQLQEWLWKEKGLWVYFTVISIRRTLFKYEIADFRFATTHFCDMDIYFNTPSEALSDGLLKAVEIVKERNSK